jgi:hypothetical protein
MATLINEPVSVPTMQNGFFPKAFVWRGRQVNVWAVESCHTKMRRGQSRTEQHFFRVRADGAVFELVQDIRGWKLARMWG